MLTVNETGCIISISHISGDILCRWSSEECDCLVMKSDPTLNERQRDKLIQMLEGTY